MHSSSPVGVLNTSTGAIIQPTHYGLRNGRSFMTLQCKMIFPSLRVMLVTFRILSFRRGCTVISISGLMSYRRAISINSFNVIFSSFWIWGNRIYRGIPEEGRDIAIESLGLSPHRGCISPSGGNEGSRREWEDLS